LASKDFAKIKKLSLAPFDDFKGLIKCFCSHRETPEAVYRHREQLLEVSKNNYWLLAFALKGCTNAHGKGEPISWIADEVKKYLRNLETCEDTYDDQYPRIVVALSPLYKNEVLTVESYLIEKLGFTKPALYDLAKRGEITRQEDSSENMLYGLPHSSLARAYWEHGRQYIQQRRLQRYEEWICDYAGAVVPNGLAASLKSDPDTMELVFNRLYAQHYIEAAIENETDFHTVASWLYSDRCRYPVSYEILRILVRRMSLSNDFFSIGDCLGGVHSHQPEQAQRLWDVVDKRGLANRMSITEDFLGLSQLIECLRLYVSESAAERILELVDLNLLGNNLADTPNAGAACLLISQIFATSVNQGGRLSTIIDTKKLATNLMNHENTSLVFEGLGCLFGRSDILGGRIWKLLDKSKLAARLNGIEDVYLLTECLRGFFGFNTIVHLELGCGINWKRLHDPLSPWTEAADEVLELLDPKRIADMLERSDNTEQVVTCISTLCGIDQMSGYEIMRLLGSQKLLQLLLGISLDPCMYTSIAFICLTWPSRIGREFMDSLDIRALAHSLSDEELPVCADTCINRIRQINPTVAERLCGLLNINSLAQNLRDCQEASAFEAGRVTDLLNAIELANPHVGLELRNLLTKT
jgi:hypothetical protein